MLKGRTMLAYLGPLLGILFIAWSTSHDSNSNPNYFNTVYVILLIVFGFYQATTTMSEHKTADGRQSSLTVPASDTEKFMSAWMYSGPLFFILYTLAFFVLTWVVTGILGMFGVGGVVAFDPTNESVLKNIKFFFLVAQPLGLLAAIAFDRFAAGKMIGSIMAIAFGLAALAAVTVRIVYRDAFEGFFTPVGNVNIGDPQMAVTSESPLILLLVLGTTLLAATYFKFQEKSV